MSKEYINYKILLASDHNGIILRDYIFDNLDNNKDVVLINTDKVSNISKCISFFLSSIYPRKEYPDRLVRGLENITNHFNNNLELLNFDYVSNINKDGVLNSFIYELIHICLEETGTDFSIDRFFNFEKF